MLITGIRQKLNAEFNTRRSAMVRRYLIHFFQMFAFLGIIFPALIVIDYFCFETNPTDEIVRDKYYKLLDNLNQIEYCFYTDTYRFNSDKLFYEHTHKNDLVTLSRTPIFHKVTNVSHRVELRVYNYKPIGLFRWYAVVTFVTFLSSFLLLIFTRFWIHKRMVVKSDTIINFGIFNSILCLITMAATMLPIMY